MNIAITGSNGFIGKEIQHRLSSNNLYFQAIPRDLLYHPNEQLEDLLNQSDIVINLAGASIQKRWTRKHKLSIYQSRVFTTRNLVKTIEKISQKPKKLISISAIGIYDSIREHDEYSHYLSNNFLGKVCRDWEHAALFAKNFGLNVYILRLGIVLGNKGGVIKKLMPLFKLGLGASLGNGKQAMSFIHIEDLINIISLVIENKIGEGIYNLVSPTFTTNKEFSELLARKLHKPLLFSIPAFVLKLLYSEGSQVLLDGQKVIPAHLLEQHYEFSYPTINEALDNIVSKSQS